MKPELIVKYKKGDYIVSLKTYSDQFTKGKIYRLRMDSIDGCTLSVELDDLGSVTNGWRKNNFIYLGSSPDMTKLIRVIYGLDNEA